MLCVGRPHVQRGWLCRLGDGLVWVSADSLDHTVVPVQLPPRLERWHSRRVWKWDSSGCVMMGEVTVSGVWAGDVMRIYEGFYGRQAMWIVGSSKSNGWDLVMFGFLRRLRAINRGWVQLPLTRFNIDRALTPERIRATLVTFLVRPKVSYVYSFASDFFFYLRSVSSSRTSLLFVILVVFFFFFLYFFV